MKEFTDEDINSFLDQETASWRPLTDEVYVGVPDDIAEAAKQGDREQLQISCEDLISVIRERRDKASFAYQYELWSTDYMETFLDFIKNPRGETEEIQTAMLSVLKNGLLYKLTAMERWYHTVFTDTPVNESPDQEMLDVAKTFQPKVAPTKTGCMMLLCAMLGFATGWAGFLSIAVNLQAGR